MPAFDPVARGSGPLVRGFRGDGFIVDGAVFAAVLLTPEQATAWDAPAIADLTVEALGDLLEDAPEFLLLGSGATLARPSAGFVRAVEAMGIGVEVMDSRAAARTWSVLRSEGRQAVAALMPLA